MKTIDNEHIGLLSNYVLHVWPSTKLEVKNEVQPYWSFRDEIVVIDGIDRKGIIIPT